MQTTTPTPSQTEAIIHAARESLTPCPFQPRKNFIESKLGELGLNLRENGVINPLLVRRLKDGKLEIICGECRWRSSAERPHPISGTIMPAIAQLPIIVRELTDSQALELMLSENMQRNDLTELEEAEAFAHALKQTDETGKLVHTQETLAAKIGVGRGLIRDRLSLMKLPKEGREALAKGAVAYRVVREVCRAPLALVPKLLDTVLNPRKFPGWRPGADHIDDPITAEEVRDLTERMSATLDDAPFALDDSELVPLKTHPETGEPLEGGPCVGCVFNSATNAAPEAEETKRGRGRHGEQKRCLNASCYKKKVDVHVGSQLTKLKAEGAHLLKESEAEKVLKGGANGSPSPDYVELDRKLEKHELAPGVSEKKAPTWGEVTSDAGGKSIVPILVAVDAKGNVRRFTERKVANVAAEKTGKAKLISLAAGRGKSVQMTEAEQAEKKRRAAEIAAQRLRVAISRHTMNALVEQVVEQGVPSDVWPNFLDLAVTHAGQAGVLYVCKRRGLEGKEIYKAARELGRSLKGSELIAFVVELLLAEWFSYACGPNSGGSVVPDSAKPVFKFYGVDLKKAEASAKAEIAAAIEAKKPKKEDPAKMAAKSLELEQTLTKAGYSKSGLETGVSKEGLKLVRQVARANKLKDWPKVQTLEQFDALIAAVKARIAADLAAAQADPWKTFDELDEAQRARLRSFYGISDEKLRGSDYNFSGEQIRNRKTQKRKSDPAPAPAAAEEGDKIPGFIAYLTDRSFDGRPMVKVYDESLRIELLSDHAVLWLTTFDATNFHGAEDEAPKQLARGAGMLTAGGMRLLVNPSLKPKLAAKLEPCRAQAAHIANARPWFAWANLTDEQKNAARTAHETLNDRQLAGREFQFTEAGECFDARPLSAESKESAADAANDRELNKWTPFEKVTEGQRKSVKAKFPKYSDKQLANKEFWFDGDALIEARSKAAAAKGATK